MGAGRGGRSPRDARAGRGGARALLDEVDHLRVGHALIETALEVGAAQFDRVEAAALRRVERLGERRGVDRPHVEREAAEFRHYNFLRLRMTLSENRFPLFGVMHGLRIPRYKVPHWCR